MLSHSPRESELMAERCLENGIQDADQARCLQSIKRTAAAQSRAIPGPACLVP
jgi:hypothetical protein